MNKKTLNNSDHYKILRKIHKDEISNQRKLAFDLGYSLGKLNYCLTELKKKGLIKLNNFKKQKDKAKYARHYILTKKGLIYRSQLTIKFLKIKAKEYDELKKEAAEIYKEK